MLNLILSTVQKAWKSLRDELSQKFVALSNQLQTILTIVLMMLIELYKELKTQAKTELENETKAFMATEWEEELPSAGLLY